MTAGSATPDFAEAWQEIIARNTEILEQIAVRRAAEGSDQLLMFLLRARKPHMYVERHQLHHMGQVPAHIPPIELSKELSDRAHDFLAHVRESSEGREAIADMLRARPAGDGNRRELPAHTSEDVAA